MSSIQSYYEDKFKLSNLLYFPNYVPSETAIVMNDVNYVSFKGFINIKPVTENKLIPLDTLWQYTFATKFGRCYFYDKSFKKYPKKYKAISPYLTQFVGGRLDNMYLVETAKNQYYIRRGIILDKDMKPIIMVMVEVAPSSEDPTKLKVIEPKVLVDYSVFESKNDAEKAVKSIFLPIFMKLKYKIEVCNLADIDVYDHPIMPKRIEKSRDLVYNVLSDNFRALDKMFS